MKLRYCPISISVSSSSRFYGSFLLSIFWWHKKSKTILHTINLLSDENKKCNNKHVILKSIQLDMDKMFCAIQSKSVRHKRMTAFTLLRAALTFTYTSHRTSLDVNPVTTYYAAVPWPLARWAENWHTGPAERSNQRRFLRTFLFST